MEYSFPLRESAMEILRAWVCCDSGSALYSAFAPAMQLFSSASARALTPYSCCSSALTSASYAAGLWLAEEAGFSVLEEAVLELEPVLLLELPGLLAEADAVLLPARDAASSGASVEAAASCSGTLAEASSSAPLEAEALPVSSSS